MSSWFVTVMVLGVPIFDMGLVVFSRLRRRHPIYRGARDHTYHRLRLMSLDSNRAVLVMHLSAIILGCLAVVSLKQSPLVANTIFGVVLVCAGLLGNFLERCRS